MAFDQRAADKAYGVQHIDEAYVKSLADPLVRYMGEPPHDPLTVLAIACRAALSEAWEHIEMAERNLAADDPERKRPLHHVMQDHAHTYVGRRVIRRVAEVLKLMHPGPLATPGKRVYAARTRKRLTCPDVAALIGVNRAHVSRIERGERTLTRRVAVLLAGPLGVTPDYLLTGRDPDGQADSEA